MERREVSAEVPAGRGRGEARVGEVPGGDCEDGLELGCDFLENNASCKESLCPRLNKNFHLSNVYSLPLPF